MMHGNVVFVTLFRFIVQVTPQDLLLHLLRLRFFNRGLLRFLLLLQLRQVKFVGMTHLERFLLGNFIATLLWWFWNHLFGGLHQAVHHLRRLEHRMVMGVVLIPVEVQRELRWRV